MRRHTCPSASWKCAHGGERAEKKGGCLSRNQSGSRLSRRTWARALRVSTRGLGGYASSWQYALCGAAHRQRGLWALALLSGSARWTARGQTSGRLGRWAPWIWKLVSEQFPGAVQIVDLYHAQQHVWQVAHAVFGHSSPQATSWAQQACRLLVHGQVVRRFYRNGAGARSVMEVVATEIKKLEVRETE